MGGKKASTHIYSHVYTLRCISHRIRCDCVSQGSTREKNPDKWMDGEIERDRERLKEMAYMIVKFH